MNRLLLPFLLGILVTASPAQARIGETLEQCIERYGPVQDKVNASLADSDDGKACVFSKLGITTVVEFKGGVAWRVLFRLPGMTPTEAESLLKANIPEGGWSPSQKFDGQEFRVSADHRRIAVYSPTKAPSEITTLVIATRDYAKASHAAYLTRMTEAQSKAKTRTTGKNLEGF